MLVEYEQGGAVLSVLPLWKGMHDLESSIGQAKGVAIGPQGDIFIVSEPNLFYRFSCEDRPPRPAASSVLPPLPPPPGRSSPPSCAANSPSRSPSSGCAPAGHCRPTGPSNTTCSSATTGPDRKSATSADFRYSNSTGGVPFTETTDQSIASLIPEISRCAKVS